MKHKNQVFQTISLISQLGISIIVPVLLCTVIGVFLDKKFSCSLTIPLIILGVLAGVRNAYVLVRHVSDVITSKEDEKK